MPTSQTQQQVDIFAADLQQRQFAELCNALYERELQSLAKQSFNSMSLLQRRLAGLTHHIKNAAEHLLNHSTPIEVDIHNASWQAKQSSKSPFAKHDQDKTQQWFAQHVRMGLPVPVYSVDMGQEWMELDSIDRIQMDKNLVHLNKNGWFYLGGEPQVVKASKHQHSAMLIPNKTNMIPACCGHTWNHKGKTTPRALSLRELLLSTTINWKTFR